MTNKENTGDAIVEESNKRKLKVSYSWFTESLRMLLKDFFNLRKDADVPGTAENIKKDAQFKGYSVWILIFSIFIASIGLNVNSPAVVIGAMLISPLMGPIQGIGLSLGTNDFETLISSFRNLVIMVIVALLTSYIFFSLSPFQEAKSELLGRTKPHLFDAFVAIFGGFSGIIGGSRKERGNVIPGVAIATALMPPLCTAGYGLATHQIDFFIGASYLFLLNSAFICISTIVVVKYLRVPLVRYVNSKRERQIRLLITVLAFVVIIPSFLTLYSVTTEYKNEIKIKSFVRNEMNYKKSLVLETNYKYNVDTLSTTDVLYEEWINKSNHIHSVVKFVLTGEIIDSVEIARLNKVLPEYVSNTELILLQASDKSYEYNKTIHELESDSEMLDEAYEQSQQKVIAQDNEIVRLKAELEVLSKDTLAIKDIESNIVAFYPNVVAVKGGYLANSTKEEVPMFILEWSNKRIPSYQKRQMTANIEGWIEQKIKRDSIVLINR